MDTKEYNFIIDNRFTMFQRFYHKVTFTDGRELFYFSNDIFSILAN